MAAGLVLVHSPLLEASNWHDVAARLATDGRSVVVPDFAYALSGEPPFYPKVAQSVAKDVARSSGDLVLIGHSGAGALLPVIAASVGPRVRGMLFVDALLPHPGRTWFDTIPAAWKTHLESTALDGCLPPWHAWWPQYVLEQMLPAEAERERFTASLRRRPLGYFREKAPDIVLSSSVRCAYLQLSSGYEAEAQLAESGGWPTRQKMLGHLALVTDPDPLSACILDLLANLGL